MEQKAKQKKFKNLHIGPEETMCSVEAKEIRLLKRSVPLKQNYTLYAEIRRKIPWDISGSIKTIPIKDSKMGKDKSFPEKSALGNPCYRRAT